MCGGQSTTTQSTTIPPEVLARYNAVNARAEDVAKQPFQRYTGQFVAPINQQQMAGISGINQAANMAQPYFNQASGALTNAYGQANPYYGQSLNTVAGGASQANQLYGTALGGISNAVNIGSQYGTDATRFINQAGTSAQPYMNQAGAYVGSGLAAADPLLTQSQKFLEGSTQAINPQEFGQAQINKYMSPYMKNVVEAQQALQQQESAAQRSALNSQAIGAGAFGGDRAGISQANLARQQTLANQATLGNLLQQGYGQAAGMFQQQQGVNLAAEQANRQAQQFGQQAAANLAQQRFGQNLAASQQYGNLGQALFGQNLSQGQALSALGQQLYGQGLGAAQAQAGIAQNQFGMSAQQANLMQQAAQGLFGMGSQYASGLAGLGTGAQAAALQGAQAQIGAGTLQQQTQQAQDTAKYNEFLQERGYPYQVAQFLANIAMGTGALSGSTTTTTGPNSFFSDRRLKKDIKEIGETHDGLPIYSFKYKGGDDQQRIGVMADEAREKHPDAVHRVGGIDAVDYEKIANRASEGGGVLPHRSREGFALGSSVPSGSASVSDDIFKQYLNFIGLADTPHGNVASYAKSAKNLPGQAGIVPQQTPPIMQLRAPSSPPRQQESGLSQAASAYKTVEGGLDKLFGEKGLATSKGMPARIYKGLTESNADKQGSKSGQNTSTSSEPPQQQKLEQTKASSVSPDEKSFYDKFIDWYQGRAYGGGVAPQFMARGGVSALNEGILPYQTEDKYGPEAVNEAESGHKFDTLDEAGGGKSGSSSGSGLQNVASLIGSAGTIAKGIGTIVSMLPFSDERVKSGMKRVGELDNGQPVYKYRIGNGPTQLGLSAQNVSKYGDPSSVYRDGDGFLHLDYERATREYGGGIRPAYQTRGRVDSDMPDIDYAIRTAAAETTGDPDETRGIAHVIHNRLQSGKYGDSYKNVVLAPNQFEPWQTENNNPRRISPDDPRYQQAKAAFEDIQSGKVDPRFENVQNFWGPISQYALKRQAPEWGRVGGLDLGGTRFHSLDEVKASHRGIEARPFEGAPANVRRSVAPAESYVDESGKRVNTVNGEEEKGTLAGLLPTNYRTGAPFKGWSDYLTDRQFVRPLFAGLAGMAQSKSRFAVPAILEGLGAAAAADMMAEKGQQEIAESQARESGLLADTRNKSIVPFGETYLVFTKGGGQKLLEDWILSQEPLEGGSATEAMARQLYARKTGKQLPAKTTDQTAQAGEAGEAGAAGPTVNRGANIPLPDFIGYDDQARKAATSDLQSGQSSKAYKTRANVQAEQIQNGATSAYQLTPALTGMAQNVASVIANKGVGSAGAGFDFFAHAYNIGNTISRTFNLTDSQGKPLTFGQQDSQADLSRKYAALISAAASKGVGNNTLGALQLIHEAIPNPNMSPDAQAKLSADFLVYNKKDEMRADFLRRYDKDSFSTPQNANAEFERINGPRFAAAANIVKDFIQYAPNVYIAASKGQIPLPEVEQYFKQAAKNRNLPYYPGMASLIMGK